VTDDLRLTGIDPAERLDFVRAVAHHFHDDQSDDDLRHWVDEVDVDRCFVVRDGERIVANLGVDPVDVSVPGGGRLPCAAVTSVGVSQTHRRRGLLRRLMTAAHDQAVERGEPVAALYASESAIYPRFGYGVSADTLRYRIDTRQLDFVDRVDGRLVVDATPQEALTAFPPVYEQLRADRPGGVGRTAAAWKLHLTVDPRSGRDGASARRLVHVPGRGYATYRIKAGDDGTLPDGEVRVAELVAADPEAEQALWQHVADIDLATTVTAWERPVDDALPWLVVDRLRLHAAVGPPLYTRLLDVSRCLAARTTTGASTGVTLHVDDASRDQTGTYRWDADRTGAACTRVDADAEVSLDAPALAALWLGGTSASVLLRARRLVEHTPGALARLDALVAADAAPATPWDF
jgi:predicted acetyltransferase